MLPKRRLDFIRISAITHNKNKVLCGRHFHSSKFYDNMRQKLSIFAVPDSDEVQELLDERENIFTQSVEQAAVAGPSIEKKTTKPAITTNQQAVAVKNVSNLSSLEQPLKSVENLIHQQPTDSIQPAATNQAFVEKNAVIRTRKQKHGLLKQLNISQKKELTS